MLRLEALQVARQDTLAVARRGTLLVARRVSWPWPIGTKSAPKDPKEDPHKNTPFRSTSETPLYSYI